MPTFDFACSACGTVFEFARPFGSKVLPPCPACGSKKTEKQMTPPVIQFKGSGFYKTDASRTSSTSAPVQKKVEEKAKTETKAEAPKEKKAEIKKDA